MDRLLRIINKFGLIVIICMAIFTRLFWIQKSPPSLNWDEASFSYNAYSILKTGMDEYGHKFPLFLRSFDDYKPALYSYLSIPFISVFGLNVTTTRVVSIISGVLTVIFIFLIAKELFRNKTIALISSFLVAVEPWSVHFSRIAFESNLALTLVLIGTYFIVKYKFKNIISLLGIIFLSLSLFSYTANQVLFIPLIIFFLIFYRKNLFANKKVLWGLIFLLFIFLLPIVYTRVQNPSSLGRLETTSIFKNNSSFYSLPKEIIIRYLSYFSPINLFVRGSPEPTMHIPGFGPYYNLEFIFFVVGFYFLVSKFQDNKLLICLLLIAPLPASITWNWFYPNRVLFLFSLFSIVIGFGLYKIFSISYYRFHKLTLLLIFLSGILFVSNFFNLMTSLLFYLPYVERGNWQYGMEQIIKQSSQIEKNYKRIVFETGTAQPYIFVLYYSKYPPFQYQNETAFLKTEIPRKTYDFGKYSFRSIYWSKDKFLTNTLFIGPESSLPEEEVRKTDGVNYIFDIKDPDGNILARMVGIK